MTESNENNLLHEICLELSDGNLGFEDEECINTIDFLKTSVEDLSSFLNKIRSIKNNDVLDDILNDLMADEDYQDDKSFRELLTMIEMGMIGNEKENSKKPPVSY